MDEFLRIAKASGLVDSDRLDEAVAPWKDATGAPVPEACIQAIIDRGLLTSWQMEQLRRGRHKGFVLGKYKLLRLLGAGGMSSVYLAEHMTLHNKVAIKVLPVKRVDKTSYLARFEREARATARLNHPHIARAFDLDTSGSIHFIVMEYIDGIDLHARVKQDGPLPVRDAANFIRQAALGLHHAHEEGVVHRDIKPANLMVDKRGDVKILDLGLALANDDDEDAGLTKAHDEKVLGTADYLSPEQARDSHKADRRSDIYSLGCTLYYLLVGKAPFAKGSLAERIRAHMNEPAPNLLDARPDAPTAIVELYFRMMEKHPDARQQTAQEVADSLAAWLATTVAASGKPGPDVPQRPSLRRSAAGTQPRRAGDSAAPRAATATAAPGNRSGADSGSGGGTGSGSGSSSGIGSTPGSAIDLHSLALTPPPSSGSRSTGRFPAVSPAAAEPSDGAAGIVINTNPLSGSGRASVGDIRRPTAPPPAANRGTPGPATVRCSWLFRRYAGLPLMVWLAGGLLLASGLLLGGWLWFGSSDQPTPGDEVQGTTELPLDTDGSATAEEPIVESKPKPDGKKKLPPKPTSRPPLRNKKPKPTSEPSGPSPLDGLDKLGPAPTGK
jgi:eukaryotic-like serine/threonine-protein kinase